MGASLASFGPIGLNLGSLLNPARDYWGRPSLPIIVSSQMLQEVGSHRTAPSSLAVVAAPDERAVLEALAAAGVAFTNQRPLDPVLDRLLRTAFHAVRAPACS